MDIKINWKIKYGIIFLIATLIIYGSFSIFYGDSHEVIHYIWLHLGFIPLDLLLLGLVIDELLSKKEKEALNEKLDMIIGTFFSEVGNTLINKLSVVNNNQIPSLNSIKDWDLKEFDVALKSLKSNPPKLDINLSKEEQLAFLLDLKEFLHDERRFLMGLINNSNLLEKEEFSALLLSVFHLCEELDYRNDVDKLSDADFKHLVGDMDRVYASLVYEWLRYLKHLKKFYPYMISIAIRTNPFDNEASVYFKD